MDGRIDERNRLLLRIEMIGNQDSLLAVVDTGFTRHLLTHRAKATELGLVVFSEVSRVVLADGRTVTARRSEATILWHGRPTTIPVLIVDAPIDPTGGDAPTDCLVGVELMNDSELLVEFGKKVFLLVHVVRGS
jgi:predicted aspartyl protease